MVNRPKVPSRPMVPLAVEDNDVVSVRPTLWRVHRVRGSFALPWNGFRTFGPLLSARWDPHPAPPADYAGYGISYAATELATAVAEVFQTSRTVIASDDLHATSWTPTRDLELLDLSGTWALRNGAAFALASARRPTCRSWSRTIRDSWEWLDGLWAPSTLTGAPLLSLYERAADSFPRRPAFSRPLSTPLLWSLVSDAADRIGYEVI